MLPTSCSASAKRGRRSRTGPAPPRSRSATERPRQNVVMLVIVERPLEADLGDQYEHEQADQRGDDLGQPAARRGKTMQQDVDADMGVLAQRVRKGEEEHPGQQIEPDQVVGEGKRPVDRVAHEDVGDHQQHDGEQERHRDHRERPLDRGEQISGALDHASRLRLLASFADINGRRVVICSAPPSASSASNSCSAAEAGLPRPSSAAAHCCPTSFNLALISARAWSGIGSKLTPACSRRWRDPTCSLDRLPRRRSARWLPTPGPSPA